MMGHKFIQAAMIFPNIQAVASKRALHVFSTTQGVDSQEGFSFRFTERKDHQQSFFHVLYKFLNNSSFNFPFFKNQQINVRNIKRGTICFALVYLSLHFSGRQTKFYAYAPLIPFYFMYFSDLTEIHIKNSHGDLLCATRERFAAAYGSLGKEHHDNVRAKNPSLGFNQTFQTGKATCTVTLIKCSPGVQRILSIFSKVKIIPCRA